LFYSVSGNANSMVAPELDRLLELLAVPLPVLSGGVFAQLLRVAARRALDALCCAHHNALS
jgi:hypothetical protein